MAEAETVTLAFKRYSDSGPVLLVLHGLFGSQSNWGWHNKQLAENFQVIGLDLRNHGESGHAERLDYSAMAADVREFMREQKIAHCHVLGHSMGGKVAMEIALTTPDLIDKLIVVDIAPVSYDSKADGHLQVMAGMRALNLQTLNNRKEAEEVLSQYIQDEGTRQFVLTNLQKQPAGGYRWRLNLDAIEANYDSLRDQPASSQPFVKPTLFIKGADSNYIQAQHEEEIKALFPDAKVKIVMGAGHWVHAEKPQAVQKIVSDFLLNDQ